MGRSVPTKTFVCFFCSFRIILVQDLFCVHHLKIELLTYKREQVGRVSQAVLLFTGE